MGAGCLNFSIISYKQGRLCKDFEAWGLESRMIKIGNKSTIHCWVPKGFESPADKPVLVLLHGFGVAAIWQWDLQVKHFLSHFTLVIPDLLFFGPSTTDSPNRSESFQAECVWLVLKSLGIEKFSVVGTSYGGMVAYRLAQAHTDAVEKIVLSNSSVCMTPEDDRALCKRGGAETIPELLIPTTVAGLRAITKLVYHKPPVDYFTPNFILRDYLNVLYLPDRAEKVEMLQNLVFGKEAAPAMMTKVEKDILIMWGESDLVFLPEQAQRMKDYFGDRAELVMLKDAGHVSQKEQPEKWNQIVTEFLQK